MQISSANKITLTFPYLSLKVYSHVVCNSAQFNDHIYQETEGKGQIYSRIGHEGTEGE